MSASLEGDASRCIRLGAAAAPSSRPGTAAEPHRHGPGRRSCRLFSFLLILVLALSMGFVFADIARAESLYDVTTFAGLSGTHGSANGTGASATFWGPRGAVCDASGNIYVADDHAIRKITPEQVVTTLAGLVGAPGSADGTGSDARFNAPRGVACDAAGNIYVADTGNNIIRKITPAGVVTTLTDSTGAVAVFNVPVAVACDPVGTIYVVERQRVRKITPAGAVTTLAGDGVFGSRDGSGTAARFADPTGIACDGSRYIYVSDSADLYAAIRRITPDGTVTTLVAMSLRYRMPQACVCDSAGNIFVASANRFGGTGEILKTTPTGAMTTIAPFRGLPGVGKWPGGIACNAAGVLYVADTVDYVIQQLKQGPHPPIVSANNSNVGMAAGTGAANTGTWAEYDGDAVSLSASSGIVTKQADGTWTWVSGALVGIGGDVTVTATDKDGSTSITFSVVVDDCRVTTLAGAALMVGSDNGVGAAARFGYPEGVASDPAGNIFVADTRNNMIRKITPAGEVTKFAGDVHSGSSDGAGGAARFDWPCGIACDSDGNVYVADTANSTIRKITPGAVVSTLAGAAGTSGSADGVGGDARFAAPRGVACDPAGNVYVADAANSTIRKITPAGVVITLAGVAGTSGSTDGAGSDARFGYPEGIACDGTGNLYVADTTASTIRKVSPTGVVTTFAGSSGQTGSSDGVGSSVRFNRPEGVAVDAAGNIYVADTVNRTIRRAGPDGTFITIAGRVGSPGSKNGLGLDALFHTPFGMCCSPTGDVYVADCTNQMIRRLYWAPQPHLWVNSMSVVVNTGETAVNGGTWFEPDGDNVTLTASSGSLTKNANGTWRWTSGGPAADSSVTINATDKDGLSAVRFTVEAWPVPKPFDITTLAGSPGNEGNIDATGPAARFSYPRGLVCDPVGNVYVVDYGSQRIRKVTSAGVVTTVATISDAYYGPWAMTRDLAGNLYVTQWACNRILKVTPTGTVSELVGNQGGSADGSLSEASFYRPMGLACDIAGSIYVADTYNHTVRKISTAGVVSTLAGLAGESGSADGTGAAARFTSPGSIACDNAGNLYVTSGSTVRKITPAGVVTTLAGSPAERGARDGLGSAARFQYPGGIACSADGSLYVKDGSSGEVIRRITPDGMVTTVAGRVGVSAHQNGVGAEATFSSAYFLACDAAGNVFVSQNNHTIRRMSLLSGSRLAPKLSVFAAAVRATEGSSATNAGSWTDVDGDVVTLSASTGVVTKNPNGTWGWTSGSAAVSGTVTITGTDRDGSSTQSFSVLFARPPSIARTQATVVVYEGQVATNTGTWSEPNGDEVTLSTAKGTVTKNAGGTWSWTSGTAATSGWVLITATDRDGSTGTSFEVRVVHVPVLAAAKIIISVFEGESAANSGIWREADGDTVTFTASAGTVTGYPNGTWNWTSDGAATAGTVTITATDKDGSSTASFAVGFLHLPEVSAGAATVTAIEGRAATQRGAWSDADGDAVTLTASLGTVTRNADGSWDWTSTVAATAGTVTITATDKDGATEVSFEVVLVHAPELTVFHPALAYTSGKSALN